MKKVITLTESDLVKIVKRVVNEQDKFPTPHNKLEKAIQMPNAKPPKAPEGRNNPLWKKLVSTLQSLKYQPKVLTFDSYSRPPILSQSLNWGTTAGDRGLYGFVISSTDSKSPKEQIQLFNTNNKGNQMDMHKWWQSKGYKTNGREIEIKFSDAEKLKENIALFFAKYPPIRVK
jgi:hypothetical protein